MGLFSFGNQEKDGAPARRSRSSAGTERRKTTRAEGERRSGQASLLDPTLPEKQRARRRLVGAIALVLAAVVVLPMVLDTHPKPAADDIAINIPRQAKTADVTPAASSARTADGVAQLAPDVTPAEDGAAASMPGAASAMAASSAPALPQAASAPGKLLAASSASHTPASVVAGRGASATASTAASRAAGVSSDESAGTAAQTTQAASVAASSAVKSKSVTSHFVVSVGAFHSDASAHSWLAKLKAAGVPAYLDTRRQADGSLHLWAGPFSDRAAAEAAVKKVRDAGLNAQTGETAAGTP
jgi:DedD protein